MSDAKQLSGMEGTCDRVHPDHGHRPHQLRPDCGNWYPIGKPRPASPTPEQPAQDAIDRFDCVECGVAVTVDEDHCCIGCGRDAIAVLDGQPVGPLHGAYATTAPPAQTQQEDARKALDQLKALVAKSKMDCIYCGVEAGGPCPAGYPGCGRMDDLMADEAFVQRLGESLQAHEEAKAAQTQQGLSEDEKIGREVADLLGRAYVPDPREGEPGDAETYEGAAPLNPDKQPSPSAAPAQESALAGLIDLAEKAVHAALDGAACEFLRQTSNKQVCAEAIGAGEGRAAIYLDRLRAGKPAAQPASPEEASECLHCGMGKQFHVGPSLPCPGLRCTTKWQPEPAPEGALREALEKIAACCEGRERQGADPMLAEYCDVKEHQIARAALTEQPAREDDQKALRAAALEEAAVWVDKTTHPSWTRHSVAQGIRALAGSPAGEGREDESKELLGKKGASDGNRDQEIGD